VDQLQLASGTDPNWKRLTRASGSWRVGEQNVSFNDSISRLRIFSNAQKLDLSCDGERHRSEVYRKMGSIRDERAVGSEESAGEIESFSAER